MTDRELLKEARDALGVVTAYIENGTPLPPDDDPYWKASTALVNLKGILSRIDSALAAPEPDAMELVRQVREGSVAGHTLSSNYWKLTDSEAAALIEADRAEVRKECAPKWISVEERLPENGQVVAFIIHESIDYYGGSICAGHFLSFDYKNGKGAMPEFLTWGLGGLRASHWMPLPEPPAIEGKEVGE
jgi:hypothetical protein